MGRCYLTKAGGVGILVALLGACGAPKDPVTGDPEKTDNPSGATTGPSTGTSTGVSTGTTTNGANKVGSIESVADLKLAGALAITLPEAFSGRAKTSSLNLLAPKKSQEACLMGMTINEETRSVGEVAGFFCHLEVEKDRLKFGKKYKIVTKFGEFARILVDNSQLSSGKLTIGFCSNHQEGEGSQSRSRQQIVIDSLTENGPKGAIYTDGTGTYQGNAQSYSRSQVFDMSVAGVVSLLGKTMHKQTGNTFVREVSLELKKTGTSTLKLANKGTSANGEFFDRGYALVSETKGSAVFQSKGVFGGQTFEFARRAHFNKAGEVIGSGEVGSELLPAIGAMPSYLPADFKPDPVTGWVGQDCVDFEEEITLDPESPAHKACNLAQDREYGCWQQADYENSNEQVTIN